MTKKKVIIKERGERFVEAVNNSEAEGKSVRIIRGGVSCCVWCGMPDCDGDCYKGGMT